jgi:predicted neuraminidase
MNPHARHYIWMGVTLGLLVFIGLRDGWHVSPVPAATFVVPPISPARTNDAPEFHEQFVDARFVHPSAHVSSICELPDGRMAAVWYAGSREGARDVGIYIATRDAGVTNAWSTPISVGTHESAGDETFRYVKKVGNAILSAGTNNQLHLLYVTTGFGGWSCSQINLKTSTDGGATWSRSHKLGLSPFFNISELVKNTPTPLADGGFVVPIYHEVLGKFSELLWLRPNANGFEATKTRVSGGYTAFQPALVALNETHALMLCRAAGSLKKIHATRTADSGRTWSALEAIDLPNSNSGLDAKRLADGRLLLAFNDTDSGRDNLRLAISADGGVTWKRAATIVAEAGQEFSYPTVLQTSDGLIHVTYTWKRKGIKEATFNVAWLEAQMKGTRE